MIKSEWEMEINTYGITCLKFDVSNNTTHLLNIFLKMDYLKIK